MPKNSYKLKKIKLIGGGNRACKNHISMYRVQAA